MRFTVEELVDGFHGRAAVYARNLTIGDELRVGPVGEQFATGSAAKLLVLLAYAQGVEAGTVDPDATVVMTDAYRDQRGGSGVLRFLAAGLTPTLQDCATLMMIVSDNVATDLLLDALGGPDPVNATVARLGVHDAEISSPTVWVMPPRQFGTATPKALAEAWLPLTEDTPLGARCRAITWRHQHRDGFARHVPFSADLPDFGLPSPLRLWSKSGSYPSVSCEAGLFETDEARWILAVMATDVTDWGNGPGAAGPTLRAEISRIVFDEWAHPNQ